jgi:hypothetical protein
MNVTMNNQVVRIGTWAPVNESYLNTFEGYDLLFGNHYEYVSVLGI